MKKKRILFTGSSLPNLEDLKIPENISLEHYPLIKIDFANSTFRQDAKSLNKLYEFNLLQHNNDSNKATYAVFSSKNAVLGLKVFLLEQEKKLKLHKDFTFSPSCSFWAVGEKTAVEVEKLTKHPCLIPSVQTITGLTKSLEVLPKNPLIYFCAEESLPEFFNYLKNNSWNFLQAKVYRTTIMEDENLKQNFFNSSNENLVFLSPSGLQGFLKSIELKNLNEINAPLYSIGPTTSKAIKNAGGTVHYESEIPNRKIFVEELIKRLK